MKSGSAGLVRLGADVAIHLVAARVLHRVELGQLARVFALADGRVIARDLLDAAAPELVEPRVSDVADDRAAVANRRRP